MAGKTYVCSDLHGRYDLYLKIKEYIQEEDIVYCLGDCGDRGPDGWKLIKAVYNDPQFIYLKGNHEDMFAAALKVHRNMFGVSFNEAEVSTKPFLYSFEYRILHGNGGTSTFKDWEEDGSEYSWIKKLNDLPSLKIHIRPDGKKIYLCHAGFTANGFTPTDEYLIWDRSHIEESSTRFIEENCIVVHGHTPYEHLRQWTKNWETLAGTQERAPSATLYCEGQKLCVDCGSAFTGVASLVDLDTFKEILFFIK